MKKFEYIIIELGPDEMGVNQGLNRWGEQGWEAWHMDIRHTSYGTQKFAYFKRELPEKINTPEVPKPPKPKSTDAS